MSSATFTASATAFASPASSAPPQAGVFEGLDPTKYNPSDPIVLFIIQASIVIALTRLLYWPLGKIRQPPVIAEVITGIILGPSIMGRIPDFTNTIFPTASMPLFSLVANIGLIFYLFLVGLEIDLRFLISNWRTAVSVASLDMAIPFGMGYAIAYGIYYEFRDEPGTVQIPFSTFGLFVAVAIAITAFPVLCRILTSLNLLNATVGVITLTSGIANDVIGWVLLALCVTLVNAGNGITALWVLLVSVGYAVFLAYAVRPAFMWVLRKTHSLENGPTQGVVALTVFMVLCSAWFTSIIGAHSVFGAFMIGLVCPHEGGFAIKLTEKLEDMIATLFLPLFFARSGLSTNLGLLDSGTVWGYVIGIIAVAFTSKIFGGTMGARLNGLVWRESLTIGVLMSCKGLVELIVLNIGLQAKILSTRTFTMFVVMALVTTFATTPLVGFLYPPAYQRKLELWKKGKIDWNGNSLHPEDGSEEFELGKKVDVANRLLVYLRADGLSSLFSVMNLFTGVEAHSSGLEDVTSSSEKPGFTASLRTSIEYRASVEHQVHRKRLRIHSLRLTELSERNSSVMQVSELPLEAAFTDPIIRAFGTITTSHKSARDVVISGQVAVVPSECFAETLTTKALHTHSDFILVPWSETGTLSELPSYLVGKTINPHPLANRDFARLADELFCSAKNVASIGVFVDRTLLRSIGPTFHGIEPITSNVNENAVTFSTTDTGRVHLHVIYASSADDLFAVKLALQLAQNPAIHLSITKITAVSGVSHYDTHANDTVFEDLKSHASKLIANPITNHVVESATVQGSVLSRTDLESTLFIVGRSEPDNTEDLSGVRSVEVPRTLGVVASSLIEKIKAAHANASVLVVQGKPKRKDYTVANNYRPISLLPTLGKALESVVAERIAYLVEEYNLLPKTHFGARKQRSTTHALSFLCEDIFRAWRGMKTLSLVSFDVKGAYNNVATGPEIRRLRQRQIPETIVRWVQDFCTDRQACILVNGFTSAVQELPQAGLPQGSALAPILFLFFNADLVQSAPKNGSSMAFVDDYSAWVVGPSADANTRIIQDEVVPMLERWERTSGAQFEAAKTSFIHLTRYKGAGRDSTAPLRFKGSEIEPTDQVRILGVTLDKELRFKAHLADKAGKATKVALALRRLKGLPPKTVKQLAISAVLPVADYASPIWFPLIAHEQMQLLQQAQRITAQAVIRGFRTVALTIVQVEAGLLPLEQRLRKQAIAFWVSIHKLGKSHPHWMLRRQRLCRRHRSPLQRIAEMCEEVKMDEVMEVKAYACPPWVARPEVVLCKDKEHSEAIIQDRAPGQADLYVDGSVRNRRAGVGIYTLPSRAGISKTVASSDQADPHLTELLAIDEAANWPWSPVCTARDRDGRPIAASSLRIFSDSQSALLSIQSWRAGACQEVVTEIIKKLRMTKVTLYWVPGHVEIQGNERAHKLAKAATRMESEEPPRRNGHPWYLSRLALKRAGTTEGPPLVGREDIGRFTRKIDAALHLGLSAEMYQQLTSAEAAILTQLRTGKSFLKVYLYKIQAEETAACECGPIESVAHFLFSCRRWTQARTKMRQQHGERFGDLSYALGGYSSRQEGDESIDGPIEQWRPDMSAVRATIEFAKDTGRLSGHEQDEAREEEEDNERRALEIPSTVI